MDVAESAHLFVKHLSWLTLYVQVTSTVTFGIAELFDFVKKQKERTRRDRRSDAGPETTWLVPQDPTCQLISSDHEVTAGYPAYSDSHTGRHTH
jgi:hypothetical protein